MLVITGFWQVSDTQNWLSNCNKSQVHSVHKAIVWSANTNGSILDLPAWIYQDFRADIFVPSKTFLKAKRGWNIYLLDVNNMGNICTFLPKSLDCDNISHRQHHSKKRQWLHLNTSEVHSLIKLRLESIWPTISLTGSGMKPAIPSNHIPTSNARHDGNQARQNACKTTTASLCPEKDGCLQYMDWSGANQYCLICSKIKSGIKLWILAKRSECLTI